MNTTACDLGVSERKCLPGDSVAGDFPDNGRGAQITGCCQWQEAGERTGVRKARKRERTCWTAKSE